MLHHGAGSTDRFPTPGCLTPWVLQQHLTSAAHTQRAAGSQSPWRARLCVKGVISSARLEYPLDTDI